MLDKGLYSNFQAEMFHVSWSMGSSKWPNRKLRFAPPMYLRFVLNVGNGFPLSLCIDSDKSHQKTGQQTPLQSDNTRRWHSIAESYRAFTKRPWMLLPRPILL